MLLRSFGVFFMLVSIAVYAAEPKEVFWEDLVPEGFEEQFASPLGDHENPSGQLQPNAPLVESLNGAVVKIPGFVVPLEGEGELTTEFLLVPYFGACIHVPPPPSNQIVYVRFKTGVPIDDLYDAVWVTGKLSTGGWSGDIASAGYTLTGVSIEAYE